MAQINQYPIEVNGANPLNNDDLFDVDKLTNLPPPDGPFQSQKLSYGYLLTQITSAIGGGNNLGNSDLNQTQQQRTFNGSNQNLLWDKMRQYFIELSEWGDDPQAGFKINQSGTPGINRTIAEISKQNVKSFRVFEGGRVEAINGGIAVGDGTLGLAINPNDESNPGILALFISNDKPSVFTDIVFPNFPTTFEPQNSAVAWFRSFSKGVLFPNLSTTERNAIITPEQGLVIYNTTTNKMQVYNGSGATGWQNMN